jgi:hypothetical protein
MAKIPHNDRFTNRSMMIFDDDDEDTTRSAPAATGDYTGVGISRIGYGPGFGGTAPGLGGTVPGSGGGGSVGSYGPGSGGAGGLGRTSPLPQGSPTPAFEFRGLDASTNRPGTRTNALYYSNPK